jgi:hypothetical protein
MYSGILHVHSDHSYDGQHSLAEIRDMARRRGYAFVGMAEHSNTLSAARVARLVDECRRLSTGGCRIIPGIEFSCRGGLHLIGFGLTEYSGSTDPYDLARFIADRGCLAVLAHPQRYLDRIPADLAPLLHGIEIWNARYDGRFIPDHRCLDLLTILRQRNASLRGYGGVDLHEIADVAHVRTVITTDDTSEASLLAGLGQGRFTVSSPYFSLDAEGARSRLHAVGMVTGRRVYELARGLRDLVVEAGRT